MYSKAQTLHGCLGAETAHAFIYRFFTHLFITELGRNYIHCNYGIHCNYPQLSARLPPFRLFPFRDVPHWFPPCVPVYLVVIQVPTFLSGSTTPPATLVLPTPSFTCIGSWVLPATFVAAFLPHELLSIPPLAIRLFTPQGCM